MIVFSQFALLQMRADISVDTKQSHMTGVQFPVTDEALKNLVDLKEKKLSLVQLVSQTSKTAQTTIYFVWNIRKQSKESTRALIG